MSTPDTPPPAQPPQPARSGCLTAIMVIAGIIMLLPGLCSLVVGGIGLMSGGGIADGMILGIFAVTFLIALLGALLIRAATRR
ncbi:hypothetical protein [Bradyrhizobium sp. 2TAF24]|uniref:hypothetical protein n=1 Tax=Bradyrhizobium sp. 2TAF24 TaxID=3233011 RepID=UPI003F8F8B4C